MPIELNEADLVTVGKIQELKVTTPARAREIYRKAVSKLANPDVGGRADIIWENIQRGSKSNELKDIMEDTVKEKKTKKAVKPKAEKKAKTAKAKQPREEVALPAIEREVELTPMDGLRGVYTANLFGRKHAVAFIEADRKENGDTAPLHFGENRIAQAKKAAKENEIPVALCGAILVKGKPEQGYAVPAEVFGKFSSKMSRERIAMSLSAEARNAYHSEGWDGLKFVEKKAA